MDTEYTYSIDDDKDDGTTWRTYVARIVGPDSNYILKRDFKRVQYCRAYYGVSVSLMLADGLYEACISRFDKASGERIERERWWIVVADEDIYKYAFSEMNWQYALYTAYNIKVNLRGACSVSSAS